MIMLKMEMEQLSRRINDPLSTEYGTDDLSKARSLRRELKQMDEEFRMLHKAIGGIGKPRVNGFQFPITREEDVERLETAVRSNSDIRAQYVEYLDFTKPFRMSVQQVFSKFFTDEAMTNYNWHGVDRAQYPRTPKKGMQKYDIFYGCMIAHQFNAASSNGKNIEILKLELAQLDVLFSQRRMTGQKTGRSKRTPI
ncbi:uncharacterized protein LOC134221459 [Armigeres subalbatus]|uniref:uncharacterized protein LOC134221459 n=1 Tax=Armigeres subalbatus TaxID=124917 RepID=UPI002ED40FF3